jgi:hypothetical protein
VTGPAGRPLLLELDRQSLDRYRGQVAPWLLTVASLQSAFRRLVGATVPLVEDPLVREWLAGVEVSARKHEAAVDELYRAFDIRRTPPPLVRTLAGALLAGARGLVGQVQGRLSGASGTAWRNLRELQLSNLDSLSAFAVAQQFGLAHGRPRVVEIAFPIVHQKSEQQLLLQELFLEFATDAVLVPSDI